MGGSMRAKIRVLAALWIVCLVGAANAKTSILARSGDWEAFGGTTTDELPVCGISTSPEGKYFGLKSFSGKSTFTIQISVKEWPVKDKSKYPLTMRFDTRRPWTATATGMHFPDGDPGMEYDIAKGELDMFMREFANGKQVAIQFKQKGLAALRLGIADVGAIVDQFTSCNRDMKK
jgi:hypothetical protein